MPDTPAGTAPGSLSRAPAVVVAVFGVVVLLLVAVVGMAEAGFRELAGANRWSIHTYQVISESEGLGAAQAELETAYRGFGITGDPRFLDAWRAGGASGTGTPPSWSGSPSTTCSSMPACGA